MKKQTLRGESNERRNIPAPFPSPQVRPVLRVLVLDMNTRVFYFLTHAGVI